MRKRKWSAPQRAKFKAAIAARKTNNKTEPKDHENFRGAQFFMVSPSKGMVNLRLKRGYFFSE